MTAKAGHTAIPRPLNRLATHHANDSRTYKNPSHLMARIVELKSGAAINLNDRSILNRLDAWATPVPVTVGGEIALRI